MYTSGSRDLEELCVALAMPFHDMSLLQAAFTHSSYRNEHRQDGDEDNERLEFLGDAVLELCVSHYLYLRFPHALEGDLTRIRAAIVCEPSLMSFAKELGFAQYMRLGKGEELSGGRERASLLADVFEAFIGALYLDQGMHGVETFLARYMYPELTGADGAWRKDFKTILQEFVQRETLGDLVYETVEERGPAHDREFVVCVKIGGQSCGEGVGRSKKEAEQHAAERALRDVSHSE